MLVDDPPASEREFIALWKLYFACLASNALDNSAITNPPAVELHELLVDCGLKTKVFGINAVLRAAFDYVKRILRPKEIEGGVKLNEHTQMPVGFSGKIVFGEPTALEVADGVASVGKLLSLVDDALGQADHRLWILLDRLDVAFNDSPDLETNALGALFHAYLDCQNLQRIRVKVFLRTDIWRRITESGFREATHITRALTISWDRNSLLDLIVRRAAQNPSILAHLGVSKEEAIASREAVFYMVFPDQVEVGRSKSRALDWMIARTTDGTGRPAPRELIHLLNEMRDVQVRRLELDNVEPEDGRLFARATFKDALREVSRTRLEQTIYAEYPKLKPPIEALRKQKATQTLDSLAALWKCDVEFAIATTKVLIDIGMLQEPKSGSQDLHVPFLYRPALDLIQGKHAGKDGEDGEDDESEAIRICYQTALKDPPVLVLAVLNMQV